MTLDERWEILSKPMRIALTAYTCVCAWTLCMALIYAVIQSIVFSLLGLVAAVGMFFLFSTCQAKIEAMRARLRK